MLQEGGLLSREKAALQGWTLQEWCSARISLPSGPPNTAFLKLVPGMGQEVCQDQQQTPHAALSWEGSGCSRGSLLPAMSIFSINKGSGNAESKSQLDIYRVGLDILVLYLFLGGKLDGFISVQLKNLQVLAE